MMKTTKKLVTSSHNMILGNHRVEYNEEQGQLIANFWYFSTIICSVNFNKKTFITSDGGWGTSSTQRAINDYRRYYQDNGYYEVFHQVDNLIDHLSCMPWNSSIHVIYPHNGIDYRLEFNKKRSNDKYEVVMRDFNAGIDINDTLKSPSSIRKALRSQFETLLS